MTEQYEYEDDDENSLREVIYKAVPNVVEEVVEVPLPFYVRNMFTSKIKDPEGFCIDSIEYLRGKWEAQIEYLLMCIGYTIGLGNIWRLPGNIYNGGGGAFFIPYIGFCILFGAPVIMLEMCLGQFCGYGCSKVFGFCPVLTGLGYTVTILAFLSLISYSLITSDCLLYMIFSFQTVLPWSVCTNSFNTPLCINVSQFYKNVTNSSYETSTTQFWNLYVTGEQNTDGTFRKITEYIGFPNIPCTLCLFTVLFIAAVTIMFGVKISGKIVYITVFFPYVVLIQFIILGCTLPGALKGIKFYLYPDLSKLLDPYVYVMAIEQLLFSTGISIGGLITLSSFNRFRDNVHQNAYIVIIIGFLTSFLSGFATFSILGYMSYQSGKDIPDLMNKELFFQVYPGALATISNSNLWSILFMFMGLTLGIDTLFVLVEVVRMSIADYFPILYNKKQKIMLTTSVCFTAFLFGMILTTPGGNNWLVVYNTYVPTFILTMVILVETGGLFGIYGLNQFQNDIALMNGTKLDFFWIITTSFFVPLCSFMILVFVIKQNIVIMRYGILFPKWTQTIGWMFGFLVLSPTFLMAIYEIIKNLNMNYTDVGLLQCLWLCFRAPPWWGPKCKQYWVQSQFYSKKLLRLKENQEFLASLGKEENLAKLINKAKIKLAKN